MEYAHRFAHRTRALMPSPIRKLAPLMRRPGMISFGGGYPNPTTFAFDSVNIQFRSGQSFTIDKDLIDLACQYGPTDCHPMLLPELQSWHEAKDHWRPEPAQIQVLNGSQEGLHIMAYLFLDPGDCVAVSEPAYPGALGAFRAFTDNFLPFPIDEHGTITEALEAILHDRKCAGEPMPKFIYEVPNGHNPGGVGLSLERRKHLLEISRTFDIPILEDDPYQLIQLEDRDPLPTLQHMDTDGRVIRLDSFSKIFAPGLRIGYATGPEPVIRMFQLYKQGTNLHVSAMIQVILAGYLGTHGSNGFFRLIRRNCALYRTNRDAMVAAARKWLPETVRFTIPREGMFIWLELPDPVDAQSMLDRYGLEHQVLAVPGPAFSTRNGLKNGLRLSFSMVSEAQIETGMQRLGEMIRKTLEGAAE
ncbi:MAG TPA: PLP-dependent aminotransferase family protein [bacterium]|nr:PLP-dependent aminotransferase family protein [bacterium]